MSIYVNLIMISNNSTRTMRSMVLNPIKNALHRVVSMENALHRVVSMVLGPSPVSFCG